MVVDINLHGLDGRIEGLPDKERRTLCELVDLWERKKSRNYMRREYYRMHNKMKDLDISIPPQLKNITTCIGWPAKAVDALAARSRFDGFTFKGDVEDGVKNALSSFRFRNTYRQGVTSELISSCSFVTVTRSDNVFAPFAMNCFSALSGSAKWDRLNDRIKCGMAVMDIREDGITHNTYPVHVDLFTDTHVWEIKRHDESVQWYAIGYEHSLGRPLMEALRYCPELDRPFGKSRISRSVMTITDSAVRSMLRSEVAAEFFTAPQRYILGADESVLGGKDKWDTYMGSIVAFTNNASTGEKPTYGQFNASSMQPHVEYMRSLAAHFSGETGIPLNELGVVSDNPSSAEAIYAAKEPLIIEAECLNEVNGEALRNIGLMAMASMKNCKIDELTDAERSIMPRFKNPAAPSIVSQADAIVKLASAFPWLADTEVALEEAGFNEDQMARMETDRLKAEAKQRVNALLEVANGNTEQPDRAADEAAEQPERGDEEGGA